LGGQPVGEEVPLDVAEAGLLDIGWARTGRQPPSTTGPGRAGGFILGTQREQSAATNSWEPLLSVVWRVDALQEPDRLFCHRCWSRGAKGVFDPNSRVVLAIAEVL
jgi:hypothetical protein